MRDSLRKMHLEPMIGDHEISRIKRLTRLGRRRRYWPGGGQMLGVPDLRKLLPNRWRISRPFPKIPSSFPRAEAETAIGMAMYSEYARSGPLDFRPPRQDEVRRKHRKATAKDSRLGPSLCQRRGEAMGGGGTEIEEPKMRRTFINWASARLPVSEVSGVSEKPTISHACTRAPFYH
jgi:hypothetical protein